MTNIMPRIPGEYLARGSQDLPSPDVAAQEMAISYSDVPGFGRVRITYRRMSSRKGKLRRWFWTPESAELAD
jgi:hypothetical protein